MTTDNLFQEPDLSNAEPVTVGVTPNVISAADAEGDYWAKNGGPDDNDEILAKLDELSAKVESLTGAVNQFGAMLDFMVKSVAQIGQAFKTQGIGGLIGMLGGGKSE